jgi:hypothetical protein
MEKKDENLTNVKNGRSNFIMENKQEREDQELEKRMKREIVERFFDTEAAVHGVKVIGPGGKERLEYENEKAG